VAAARCLLRSQILERYSGGARTQFFFWWNISRAALPIMAANYRAGDELNGLLKHRRKFVISFPFAWCNRNRPWRRFANPELYWDFWMWTIKAVVTLVHPTIAWRWWNLPGS